MRYNNQAITFLPFEVRSAENLARWGEASPAEEPDGTGYSSPLIVRGAKRRELPTADTETHEVVLAPARTVTSIKESSHYVRTVKILAPARTIAKTSYKQTNVV